MFKKSCPACSTILGIFALAAIVTFAIMFGFVIK